MRVGEGPIFIVGAPRSGTSLLYHLVAAHPDLAYPDLALSRMYRRRSLRMLERLGLKPFDRHALHRSFTPKPGTTRYEEGLRFLALDPYLPIEGQFLWSGLTPVETRDIGLHHLRERPRAAARVQRRYEGILRRTGCRRFVDKAPVFTVMLEAIRELFPDAHVIQIVRDGRAVVNSIAYGLKYRGFADDRRWWGPKPPDWAKVDHLGPVERACHQWVGLVREARLGAELFPGRYHEIRYEQVVGETRVRMSELFERLLLRPFGADLYPERLENRNYKWQAESGESFGDPIWTDRRAINSDELPQLEIMRPLLEELGYVEAGASLAPTGRVDP